MTCRTCCDFRRLNVWFKNQILSITNPTCLSSVLHGRVCLKDFMWTEACDHGIQPFQYFSRTSGLVSTTRALCRSHNLNHRSTTRGLRATRSCIHWVYAMKTTQYFKRLGIPLTAVFPRAAREPPHNNRCGPLLYKIWRSLLWSDV